MNKNLYKLSDEEWEKIFEEVQNDPEYCLDRVKIDVMEFTYSCKAIITHGYLLLKSIFRLIICLSKQK